MPLPAIPWKDYETDYCRSLVMVAATREVPERSVLSYLDCQIVSARRDASRNVRDAAEALEYLEALRRYWINSARYLGIGDQT